MDIPGPHGVLFPTFSLTFTGSSTIFPLLCSGNFLVPFLYKSRRNLIAQRCCFSARICVQAHLHIVLQFCLPHCAPVLQENFPGQARRGGVLMFPACLLCASPGHIWAHVNWPTSLSGGVLIHIFRKENWSSERVNDFLWERLIPDMMPKMKKKIVVGWSLLEQASQLWWDLSQALVCWAGGESTMSVSSITKISDSMWQCDPLRLPEIVPDFL